MNSYDPDSVHAEAAVVSEVAREAERNGFQVKAIEVGDRKLYLLPPDFRLETLEQHLSKPHRLKGEIRVEDVESFAKVVARYDKGSRLVQVSKPELRIVGVLNQSAAETPAWEDHRVTLQLGLHRDLNAWKVKCDKKLSQVEFMEFLEDRISDVVQKPATLAGGAPEGPTQSALQGVASDLRVTTDSRFTSQKNLHNGNFVFECTESGKATVEVPEVFYIGVPIFEGSTEPFLIPIRLRYRIDQGVLSFFIKLVSFDVIFDKAWESVKKDVIAAIPQDVPYINVPTAPASNPAK